MGWIEYLEGKPHTFPADGEPVVVWRFLGRGVAARMEGRAYVRASLDKPYEIQVGVGTARTSTHPEEDACDDLGWDGPFEADTIFWRPQHLDK